MTEVARLLCKAAAAWWPTTPTDFFTALLALFTLLLVIFTAALVVVGCLQRRTFDATLRSNQVIERAYIGLSHTPEGFELSPGPPLTARVQLKVENHGRTPARVIDVSLGWWVSPPPLPDVPPDVASQPDTTYFLMARDHFFTRHTLEIPTATHAQVQAGTLTLYLLGCVDYEDQFARRHRGRYARRYVVASAGRPYDLIFVTERGYNDDRDL